MPTGYQVDVNDSYPNKCDQGNHSEEISFEKEPVQRRRYIWWNVTISWTARERGCGHQELEGSKSEHTDEEIMEICTDEQSLWKEVLLEKYDR